VVPCLGCWVGALGVIQACILYGAAGRCLCGTSKQGAGFGRVRSVEARLEREGEMARCVMFVLRRLRAGGWGGIGSLDET